MGISDRLIRNWDECSAREIQRQSHLQEVREARESASVSGTPGLTPMGAEPVLAPPDLAGPLPELSLPPAVLSVVPAPGVFAQHAPSGVVDRLVAAEPIQESEDRAMRREAISEPGGMGGSGDSMLESTAEVLNMVDFGWT